MYWPRGTQWVSRACTRPQTDGSLAYLPVHPLEARCTVLLFSRLATAPRVLLIICVMG